MRRQLLLAVMLFSAFVVQAQERDPTRPPMDVSLVVGSFTHWAEQLTLTQIFYSKDTQKARINEKWVTLGETVDGVDVLSIEPNSVVVEKNNETVEMTVFKPIKQKKEGSPGAVQ